MASYSASKDRGDLLQLRPRIPWRSIRVGHEQFATVKGMRFMTLVPITYAVQTPDVRKMATRWELIVLDDAGKLKNQTAEGWQIFSVAMPHSQSVRTSQD